MNAGAEPAPDAFGRLMQLMSPYPKQRVDAEVVGPGRDALRSMIPTRLWNFLSRSPEVLDTRVGFPDRGIPDRMAGVYFPKNPYKNDGITGSLWINTSDLNPSVATHEAMHAANDFSSIAKQKRQFPNDTGEPYHMLPNGVTGQIRGYPTSQYRSNLPSDLQIHHQLENEVMNNPGIAKFGRAYKEAVPGIPSWQLRGEMANEWMTRNAINKAFRNEDKFWAQSPPPDADNFMPESMLKAVLNMRRKRQ